MTTDREASRRRGPRLRGSLGTLFLAVTSVCACLGCLRGQFYLVHSDAGWLDAARRLIQQLPGDSWYYLLLLQTLGLIVGVTTLWVWRRPWTLWPYAVARLIWLGIIGVSLATPDLFSGFPPPDVLLYFIFCEPACGLVFASLAFCQSLANKRSRAVLATGLLVAFGLVGELLTILEIQAFGAALSAGLSGS